MLDPDSPIPLYQQLKGALRQLIESGTWAPGEAIPPERELITRFGVSRITVRQALGGLSAEGLLLRKHGKGTFVAPRQARPIAESLSDLTGHLEELQLRGLEPQVEVLSLNRQPMPDEVALALQRPEAAEGWHLHRRVFVDGAPLMLSEIYLPVDIDLTLQEERVRKAGMAQLLSEQGLEPVRGVQRIAAQSASAAEAELLGVKRGQALLRVVRVLYGADGSPLVWFRTLYRGDRYEYEIALKRRR